MNKVFLTGRLTRDPEMRSLASGKNVTTFTVATNGFIGHGKERAEYHPGGDLGPPRGDRRHLPRQGPTGRDRGPPPDPVLGRRSRPAALEDRGRGVARRDAVRPAQEGLRGTAGGRGARAPGRGLRRGTAVGAHPCQRAGLGGRRRGGRSRRLTNRTLRGGGGSPLPLAAASVGWDPSHTTVVEVPLRSQRILATPWTFAVGTAGCNVLSRNPGRGQRRIVMKRVSPLPWSRSWVAGGHASGWQRRRPVGLHWTLGRHRPPRRRQPRCQLLRAAAACRSCTPMMGLRSPAETRRISSSQRS